jgi:hypothetical protein
MESRLSVAAVIGALSLLGVAAYDQSIAEVSAETAGTETYTLLTSTIEPVLQLLPLIALVVVAAAAITAVRSFA